MPTLDAPVSALPFVKQSRVIRASRTVLYEAWIKPEVMKQWFNPGERVCASAELDPREGGAYRIDVVARPDAKLNPGEPLHTIAEGVYTEIVPNQKLQFTWKPSWNPGENSLVTVTFADAEGGTEVTILHERISDDGQERSCKGYASGWSSCLEQLGQLTEA